MLYKYLFLWVKMNIQVVSMEWGSFIWRGKFGKWLIKSSNKVLFGPCIFIEQIFGLNWSVLHLSFGDYRIDIQDSLLIEIRDECLPLFSRGRCFNPI